LLTEEPNPVLATRIAQIPGPRPSPETLLRLMAQDKKVKGGKLALVLARGIGQAFVERDVSMPQLTAFLARACA
jgi:3-dehydroquinate synthetase